MIPKTHSQRPSPTVAIIPAAGHGRRMGAARAKQFLEIDGTPLLAFTLRPFQDCAAVDAIILVAPPEEVGFCLYSIIL